MDTKFQKKHESDMTSREKRELEREKLASMNGKEKLEYILSYYKLHIAAVIGVIFLIIGIGVWIDDMQDESMLYAAVINGTGLDTALMEEFQVQQKDQNRHHQYVLDTSIVFSGQQESQQMDYASRVKMTSLEGARTVDLYICPKSLYQEYASEEGALLSVEKVMGAEFVAEHPDICEKDAIRVENSEILKKYGYENSEPAYLIVFYYTKHPQIVAEFVRFII